MNDLAVKNTTQAWSRSYYEHSKFTPKDLDVNTVYVHTISETGHKQVPEHYLEDGIRRGQFSSPGHILN